MKPYINTSFFKFSLGILALVIFCSFGHTQNITGPTSVEPGSYGTYTYNDGTLYSYPDWDIVGGSELSTSSSGTAYTVIVSWPNSEGSGSVTFKDKESVKETYNVTIEYGALPPTPVTDLNYVHNFTPRIATTDISTLGNNDKVEAITYFDGLGRARQSVAIRAGGKNEDIITHIEYDEFGRNIKDYLPYSSTSGIGTYRVNALDDTNTYYDHNSYDDDFPGMTTADINPYSEKAFDNSPLNRVLQQAAPGKDWKLGNGHEIEMDYLTNTSSTEVRYYSVSLSLANSVYTPTLNTSGHYSINELYKTITKDENHDGSSTKNHTTEEFKNKQGQVVLKRTYDNNVAHDTYYAYDDFGNLSFVLPPKAEAHASKPDATELSELCYQYRYDQHNRLVEKKIPGKDWEYIVYNKLDQPIMTQDANLRVQKKWLFTKYDVFGRVAYTGLTHSDSNRNTLQNGANATSTQWVTKSSTSNTLAGTAVYYSGDGNVYPNFGLDKIYTINYYDNYTFDLVGGTSQLTYGTWPIVNPMGLATGSKVRVLGTDDWITTVTYYDDKSRPIYVYSKNSYLNTIDKVKSSLTFDGRATETTTTHEKNGKLVATIIDKYTYDHANRLIEHNQKINNAALYEVIAENTYDDLGQLEIKEVGGKNNASRLQTIDYAYNVRGWLKTINDPSELNEDLFAFKINYNSEDHSGTKLYNGNISEIEWRTKSDNVLRWYKYGYDALNRITSGTASSSNYNLSSVAYDKNGNITSLDRNGHTNAQATTFGIMDDLTYTYETSSNKLKKVDDAANLTYGFKDGSTAATEYTYDANGNMLTDLNKGISSNISYNHLNLPTLVNLSSGNIQYIYDATGVKQKKIVSTGITTEYAGNFIYEDGTFKMFSHPEGYVEKPGKYFSYVYQYKDHLGNIRLTYADSDKDGIIDPDKEIIEENNYYPFGLKHKGYNDVVSANVNSVASKFKFGGKEFQDELDLDWYDFGARNYDASLGRWMNIDPLAEKFIAATPYNYTANNPVLYKDPNGKDIYRYDKRTGKLVLFKEQKGDDMIAKFKKRKGKYILKKDNKGNIKTHVNHIAKGILHDGINFNEENNVIAVNGKNSDNSDQPSESDVQDFILKYSKFVKKEISGYALGDSKSDDVNGLLIWKYNENTDKSSDDVPYDLNDLVPPRNLNFDALGDPKYSELRNYLIKNRSAKYHFHTHLYNENELTSRKINSPSAEDKQHKASAKIPHYILNVRGLHKF